MAAGGFEGDFGSGKVKLDFVPMGEAEVKRLAREIGEAVSSITTRWKNFFSSIKGAASAFANLGSVAAKALGMSGILGGIGKITDRLLNMVGLSTSSIGKIVGRLKEAAGLGAGGRDPATGRFRKAGAVRKFIKGVGAGIGGKGEGVAAGIGKTLGAVGKAAGMAAGAIATGGAALVASITAPIDIFKSLTDMIMGFVEAANPAAVEMFNLAMKDLSALIGKQLVPILQVATEIVKKFGSMLSELDVSELIGSFVEIFAAFADIFIEINRALNPVKQILINVLVVGLKALAWVVKQLAEAISWVVSKIPGVKKGKDITGMAARSIEMIGIEDIRSRAIAAAGKVGAGARPEERTAKSTGEAVSILRDIRDNTKDADPDPHRADQGMEKAKESGHTGVSPEMKTALALSPLVGFVPALLLAAFKK